jgi:hypothetical protein
LGDTPLSLAQAGHLPAAFELADRLAGLLAAHFLCRADRLAYATRKGNPCPVDVGADLRKALLSHVLGPYADRLRLRAVPQRCPEGYSVRGPFRLGTYTPAPGPEGLTVYACLDFDGGNHSAPLPDPLAAALRVVLLLKGAGLACHLERSKSGTGRHVWVLFARPAKAAVVRRALRALLPDDLKGVELFPKSDSVEYMGNQVYLPWWHGARWPCNQFYREAPDGTVAPYLPDSFESVEPGLVERLDPGEPVRQAGGLTLTCPPARTEADDRDGEVRSPEELLEWALGRAGGQRNTACFDLACQLRDAGVPQAEAERWLREYARRAPAGNHPYTEEEALGSVGSAYDRPGPPGVAEAGSERRGGLRGGGLSQGIFFLSRAKEKR